MFIECVSKCLSSWLMPASVMVVVVQSLSRVQLFANPWTAEHQAFLSFTISQSLLKLMPVESVMPFNHLIFCHPLLLSSIFQSSIRVFSDESAFCNRQPKYWSFSISPSNEYSGLISFRIGWFEFCALQGTLNSPLPQLESINSLACSLLHGPTLTSVHDYRKNYSFDYMNLCWQSDVSSF